MDGVNVGVFEQLPVVGVAALDLEGVADLVELFWIALADGMQPSLRMALIEWNELGAEAQADDGHVDPFLVAHAQQSPKISKRDDSFLGAAPPRSLLDVFFCPGQSPFHFGVQLIDAAGQDHASPGVHVRIVNFFFIIAEDLVELAGVFLHFPRVWKTVVELVENLAETHVERLVKLVECLSLFRLAGALEAPLHLLPKLVHRHFLEALEYFQICRIIFEMFCFGHRCLQCRRNDERNWIDCRPGEPAILTTPHMQRQLAGHKNRMRRLRPNVGNGAGSAEPICAACAQEVRCALGSNPGDISMARPVQSLFRFLVLAAIGLGPAAWVSADEPARISVLLLGDRTGHHRPEVFAKVIAPALAPMGIDVTFTQDIHDLNAKKLGQFDCLAIYGDSGDLPPADEQAMLDYVESGHGLVAIHCASNIFRNSQRDTALIGGRFQKHETGVFRDADHRRPASGHARRA